MNFPRTRIDDAMSPQYCTFTGTRSALLQRQPFGGDALQMRRRLVKKTRLMAHGQVTHFRLTRPKVESFDIKSQQKQDIN